MATLWLIGGRELLVPNVAVEGEATQSSTYFSRSLFDAQHAIDRNFSTYIASGAKCSHTLDEPGAWWQVDLKNQFEIKKVAVTTRKHG